jgi:hypothetical protein
LDSEGEFIPISRWIKKKIKVKDHDWVLWYCLLRFSLFSG